jgi:pimeloyl-ACP methyl ester carboxylesterase
MANGTKTVVFVQGAWMTPHCWDNLRKPFEAAGYETHAPSWPYIEGSAAELRANPPPGLGALTIGAIVDHYQTFIATLPEKPLIIGHSFGGLCTQLLLNRGIGAAGIAIDPGPIAGIILDPVSLAGVFPIVARWEGWNKAFTLSREAFAKSFANTAPPDLQASAYDSLVVPTSGRIFYQAASWIGTVVHPKRRTQPLLVTAAEKDRTVTPYVSRATYNLQRHSPARTDFVQFANRSHFLIAEPGWEEVAYFALTWAKRI